MGKTFIAAGDFYLDSLDKDRRLVLSPTVIGFNHALSILDSGKPNGATGFSIFTSSNKPHGSYVGNGSAGQEIMLNNDYVTGNVMMITCEANNTFVLVTPNGCFVCDEGGVTFETTVESVGLYANSFVIWKSSAATNYDGDTYEYCVL